MPISSVKVWTSYKPYMKAAKASYNNQIKKWGGIMASFGEILAELRQDKNLTQKDIAKYLHVSFGTISNYENNIHLPDMEKILILAKYFDVTTDYLLGRTPFNISPDLFYKDIGNGMKISDLIRIINNLNPAEQKALSLVITKFDPKCNK